MRFLSSFRMLIVMILCAAVLIGAWGAVGWIAIETFSLRASVAEQSSARDLARAKLGYSESQLAVLRDTSRDRAQIAEESSLSAIAIVNQIRSVANDAGVDISIDTIQSSTIPISGAAAAPALAVSLSAHGDFTRLYRFLELLEASSLPLSIDQVSLDQLASTPSVPWTLEARALVYTENTQ